MELGTQVKKKDGLHLSVNLRENCWATGHNMAAERPQGGLELEFTWMWPSGIIQLKGTSITIYNIILIWRRAYKPVLRIRIRRSICFWASRFRIRIHKSETLIRILLSLSKIVRKTLIPPFLWLLYDFLSLKNYVNVPSKSNRQKKLGKKLLKSWRSLTKMAGSGSGSVPKFDGSATLLLAGSIHTSMVVML